MEEKMDLQRIAPCDGFQENKRISLTKRINREEGVLQCIAWRRSCFSPYIHEERTMWCAILKKGIC